MRSNERPQHLDSECVLLDNPCCVRAWQLIRATHPRLAEDVDLLYGRDFWTKTPAEIRTLFALFVLPHGGEIDERLRATIARGLAAARRDLEAEKVRVIKQARSGR